MDPLLIVLVVIWLISGVGTMVFIMLHSGKGTGISDILASTIGGNMGTSIVEKNLDRLTIICAVVFFVCIFVMMKVYPH